MEYGRKSTLETIMEEEVEEVEEVEVEEVEVEEVEVEGEVEEVEEVEGEVEEEGEEKEEESSNSDIDKVEEEFNGNEKIDAIVTRIHKTRDMIIEAGKDLAKCKKALKEMTEEKDLKEEELIVLKEQCKKEINNLNEEIGFLNIKLLKLKDLQLKLKDESHIVLLKNKKSQNHKVLSLFPEPKETIHTK